jgi:hypothetical protein
VEDGRLQGRLVIRNGRKKTNQTNEQGKEFSMNCVDCNDTGVIGVVLAAGDFCICQAGKELRKLVFKLDTGSYPHSDCELVCGDGDDCFSCPHWKEHHKGVPDEALGLVTCKSCNNKFQAHCKHPICMECGTVHDRHPHLSPTGPNYDHVGFSDDDDPNADKEHLDKVFAQSCYPWKEDEDSKH